MLFAELLARAARGADLQQKEAESKALQDEQVKVLEDRARVEEEVAALKASGDGAPVAEDEGKKAERAPPTERSSRALRWREGGEGVAKEQAERDRLERERREADEAELEEKASEVPPWWRHD